MSFKGRVAEATEISSEINFFFFNTHKVILTYCFSVLIWIRRAMLPTLGLIQETLSRWVLCMCWH